MRPFFLLFSSAAIAIAVACGGKVSGGVDQGDGGPGSSGSGGSSGSSSGSAADNSCFETSGSSQACLTCVESQCASTLSSAESGCSAFLSCECPGGIYDQSVAESCAPLADQGSCEGSVEELGACEMQYCETPCGAVSSSGGSSSSSATTLCSDRSG